MKTVLLVDNDATLVNVVSPHIQDERIDVRVLTADSGRKAVGAVMAALPAVAVVDLELPDGEGYAVIQKLAERFPEIPIIALSTGDVSPIVESLVFASIGKPYEPKALMALMKDALAHSDSLRDVGEDEFPKDETKEPISSGYDFHKMQNRLTGIMFLLEALQADLYDTATDPDGVRRTAEKYIPRLFTVVEEVSLNLPRNGRPGQNRW